MIDILYLTLSLCSISATIFYIYSKMLAEKKKSRSFCIEKYESYIVTLDYFCKKAYDLIYKDKIMIYSLEAMALNDAQYQAASKDFCNLVFKFLGPSLVNEFTDFFGNDKTLMVNILEYFNTNYENDKIKEQATENMMGKEIEVEPEKQAAKL
jgi:hypothetical protein